VTAAELDARVRRVPLAAAKKI